MEPEESERIMAFVRTEPRAISEVAEHIGRSWVTAERYVQRIAESTGLLRVKTFRGGTRGALKLVFYNHSDRPLRDELEKELYRRVREGRSKRDFPFFDMYQWASDDGKRAETEPLASSDGALRLKKDLEGCERQLLVFSGNLSVLSVQAGSERISDVIARMVERGVTVRVLTRVSLGGLENIAPLLDLARKHPDRIELRHAEQPLRGFLIDGSYARFTDEETVERYREGELRSDVRIIYEVRDPQWAAWLERVFWNLYRPGVDAPRRIAEIQRLTLAEAL